MYLRFASLFMDSRLRGNDNGVGTRRGFKPLLAMGLLTALTACSHAPPVPIPADESPEWTNTITDVSPAIVTIRVDAVRPFDTAGNSSSQATGFVVDAKRGLILTNRHVVQPGPVVAEAIFINKEEVALTPVYYDPVHDFGLYHYNPEDLRYLTVEPIELAPDHATIGREIRVIGNDAGEQLSILAGTLSRLDRKAPNYGRGNYNDINTFYIQAASGTSGGSSGSPVIDIHGHAVALNAGARTDAASSFFLPLDRVKRALELIQQNKPVTRGTIQTVFTHRPFDELQRLGLQAATEEKVREAFPNQTGMLVVEQVVPGGPAAGQLFPGDILIRLNGQLISRFLPLEKLLDSSVGQSVTLDIQRGGVAKQVTLSVQNLYDITPDKYLEISGAILHNMSYQMARHLNRPVEGIFVADAGYMLGVAGIPRGAVITSFAGKPVKTLAELRQLLKQQPDGAQVQVGFFSFDQPRRRQIALVTIDRQWFPGRFCERKPDLTYWDCTPLQSAVPSAPTPEPVTVDIADYPDPRLDKLAHSLVYITFDMPYAIDGVDNAHYYGTGLVVDAERGLVVTDRNTVPVALGDVHLTIGGSAEIPARVVYIHPLHNLVMLQYDPALLG
ncbi:MAG TPA: trypsin-like peptidase domain-containing protein, partial [Gammaproteobacteria bacterium]|nr:trypsin-like peptidase domain-containing protein [Gammaproteobacteria bacterium]